MTLESDMQAIKKLVVEIAELYEEIIKLRNEDREAYKRTVKQLEELEKERSRRTRKKNRKKRVTGSKRSTSITPIGTTPKEKEKEAGSLDAPSRDVEKDKNDVPSIDEKSRDRSKDEKEE